MPHRNFRDLLGKLIKNDDTVLYIWPRISSKKKGHGGESVRYIVGKVVGFTKKSIKVEHIDPNKTIPQVEQLNVFNTKGKVIVMKDNTIGMGGDSISDLVELQKRDIKKYKKEIAENTQTINRANAKIKRSEDNNNKLKAIIDEIEKDSERFRILDL